MPVRDNVAKPSAPVPAFVAFIRKCDKQILLRQSFNPRGFFLPAGLIANPTDLRHALPEAIHELTGLTVTPRKIFNDKPVFDKATNRAITYALFEATGGRRTPGTGFFWVSPRQARGMLARTGNGTPPYLSEAMPVRPR